MANSQCGVLSPNHLQYQEERGTKGTSATSLLTLTLLSQGNKGDGLGETYLCGQEDNPLLMKISCSEIDWGPQNLTSASSVGGHGGRGRPSLA